MNPLEDLLQQCTVKITIPGGWGTGFFVSPGLILTCAHVVQRSPRRVPVEWQNKTFDVLVERSIPDPYDLALLRVLAADGNPPCVFLDEEVRSRDPLYLFGYPDEGDRQGEPRTFNCDGITGSKIASILFNLGQVRPGMSGSPLLNQRTGKVCGMVKFTRDRTSDLGGGAIPTRVILEQFPELRELQRVFHGGNRCWVNLISTQPEIDFQPYLQAILANDDYREWQTVYTRTTVESRQPIPEQQAGITSQRRFSSRLKLRVKAVNLDKQRQGNQSNGIERQEQGEQWEVLAGLRHYAVEHLVLIGKPGSGKSTSLERLLWEEAEKALQDPNTRIPVLVKLRRCTGSVEGLIRDFLLGHQVALEIVQIQKLLCQGRFLLLLDGLNELPKAFETDVANFRYRYHAATPMIVSTRDLGGGGTLGIEKTLKMLPLTEPQMREFVRGYLGEEGDRLFEQLQGDRLEKFAETPLLLWMLCRVFAHSGKIPNNLGLAFREFAQLHDRELQADAPADSKDQWHKLLRHLAFVMMQGKSLTDPELSISKEEAEDCLTEYLQQIGRSNPRDCAERWLKDLLKYHLIQPVIQPNLEEHIEFCHQLIQEYYAAGYLLKLLPTLTDDQLKQNYLNYLKWTEPIALMLALEDDEAQSLRVVKLAINQVDLMLGAKLAENVTCQESVSKLIEFLKTFNESDWEIRTLLIRELGVSKSAAAIPLLIEELDNELTYSTATDALENLGIEMLIPRLLKFWKEDSYVISRGEGIYLSLRDDAYTRLGLEPVDFLDSDEMVFILRKIYEDPDWDICTSTLSALAGFGITSTIPDLLRIFRNLKKYKSVNMAELFGNVGNEALILKVLKIVEELDYFIDKSAVEALDNLGSKVAYPTLIEGLFYPHWLVCRIAADALGYIGCNSAVSRLIKILGHSNWFVRRSAKHAIIKISGESTMDVYLAIFSIQENCKFYNYEIYQAHLAAQQADRQDKQKSDRPSTINQFPNATEVKIFENVEKYHESPPP